MTTEELKAKLANVASIDEAYALVKECGFTGSMDDFKAACSQAAETDSQLDMDAMDSVAGGTALSDLIKDYKIPAGALNVLLGPLKPQDLIPQITIVEA